jgi:hypothetical protein
MRRQMQNNNNQKGLMPEEQRGSEDVRESPKGKLPCGARYCFRCHDECGVLVNAYIMRDIENESSADDL